VRWAVVFILLGCGSTPPPDRTVPDDLDLVDSPFDRRDAGSPPVPGTANDAASATASPSLKIDVVSDPAEPRASTSRFATPASATSSA
jgi:hypothetical protein